MNIRSLCVLTALAATCHGVAFAEDSALWGWSVSAGGNFGFGLKTDLKTSTANALRCLPALTPAVVGPTRQAAESMRPRRGGERVTYDAGSGYFIDPSSSWGNVPGHESETWNWRMPDSAVVGEGAGRHFEVVQEWGEVTSTSTQAFDPAASDSSTAYGASVELSHSLWVSEEAKWGVDIAFGLTWMKSIDCFKLDSVAARRSATVSKGTTTTSIPGEFFALEYARAEDDGTWGNGTYDGNDPNRDQYLIDLDDITVSSRQTASETYSDAMSISARGDYEEWEIAMLLRPWYELTDWLSLHGALGIGVTRSSFEYSMNAVSGGSVIYRSSEEFSEWRCYGLVGGGLVLHAWGFDISCDGLYRWCQQDMNINGRDVQGTLEKPCVTLRLGLSYAF